jgi:Fe-S cluster assembly protein SufD
MSAALSSPVIKSWQGAFAAQPDISASQRRAFDAFLARGLPTTKIDSWKYTDLRRLALKSFRAATANSSNINVDQLLLSNLGGKRFVFVDGIPLRAATKVVGHNTTEKLEDGAFELLNVAFSSDSVQVEIADDHALDLPIYVAFVWTKTASALMTHPRVSVKLGRNSSATLIEHHIGANTEANFTNTVFDIDLVDHAVLEHIRVQDDAESNFNICNVNAKVARGARYLSHQYVIGGGLARTDICVNLAGAEAHVELHGLVFAHQTQHLDVHTVVDHQVPNTTSIEDYRGIADHRGRVVFNGKVIVSKDAQRTDARQSSRNLLLSPQAEIDTRPELEIYANDVKCAHGATVGQLDAAALFYLQSRGIARAEARALLTHAFAAEVIERIPVPAVRDHVLSRLMSRMRTTGVAL